MALPVPVWVMGYLLIDVIIMSYLLIVLSFYDLPAGRQA